MIQVSKGLYSWLGVIHGQLPAIVFCPDRSFLAPSRPPFSTSSFVFFIFSRGFQVSIWWVVLHIGSSRCEEKHIKNANFLAGGKLIQRLGLRKPKKQKTKGSSTWFWFDDGHRIKTPSWTGGEIQAALQKRERCTEQWQTGGCGEQSSGVISRTQTWEVLQGSRMKTSRISSKSQFDLVWWAYSVACLPHEENKLQFPQARCKKITRLQIFTEFQIYKRNKCIVMENHKAKQTENEWKM